MRAIKRQSQAPASGFSLVEIMIGLVLGLLLIVVVLSVFMANHRSFSFGDGVSRVQENSRFLQESIAKDIRISGYKGCMSKTIVPMTSTLNNATTVGFDYGRGLEGFDNITTLPTRLAGFFGSTDPTPVASTDMLILHMPAGNMIPIAALNTSADIQGQLEAVEQRVCPDGTTTNIGFCVGDIVMAADCKKSRVFQATAFTLDDEDNPTLITLTHSQGGSFYPANTVGNWSPAANKQERFTVDAELFPYQSLALYIANNPESGLRAMYQKVNGGPAQLMQDGVFNMQVSYGIDHNADREVDNYATAGTITNWSRVMSIRIELLLYSAENNLVSSPQQLFYNGSTISAPDNHWYMVSIINVVLRNRIS